MPPEPTGAELADPHLLLISWSDGKTLEYPVDLLRAACPCAHCNPTGLTHPAQPREEFHGVTLDRLEEVGSYAFRISFSDGHGLGIYTFPRLLELGAPRGTTPPPKPPPSSFDV